MENFALVEADFQQYYNIDLDLLYSDGETGYLRYARLFSQLPPTSRIMRKLVPANSWEWNDEVQSRILAKLDSINTNIYNSNRKKGSKAEKPDPQFQPDYVKEVKDEFLEQQKRKEADVDQMREFWKARNPKVKMA